MSDVNTRELERRLRESQGGDMDVANALAATLIRAGENPAQSYNERRPDDQKVI